MYRLLIIAGLLVLFYFLVRSAIRELLGKRSDHPSLADRDTMVEDPVCHTYVPKGSAVVATVGDQTYYFCSQDCARSFQQGAAGRPG